MLRTNGQARVSVIIPTYNRADLLCLTVESVLAQTYRNIEIIVVDDGSTDNTATVMANYGGRVIHLKQANQGDGGVTASNTGLEIATGEYINFLDHDDLMLPTKIERQMQIMNARPEIGLVHCGYYHIDKDGNRLERISFLPEGTLKELICINPIWSGGPLIRRPCLDQVGGYRDMWSSDWDLWIRIAQTGCQFACIQEPLGAYRIFSGSQMMGNVAKLEQASFALLDEFFADPQLPADVLAVKTQAYGTTHLWLSWRYYGAGLWDDARRNLSAALARLPHLLEQPDELLESLADDALGVRISDPLQFIAGVLDHLPASAAVLNQHRTRLLARVYVGLALRDYAFDQFEEGKRNLEAAIALNPALLIDHDAFARLVWHYATRLPVNAPDVYVETVFRHLPSGAQQLARVRSRVLSDVQVTCAFEDYYAGRRSLVVPQILKALRYRPAWVANKGVVSIFVRSLPDLLSRAHGVG